MLREQHSGVMVGKGIQDRDFTSLAQADLRFPEGEEEGLGGRRDVVRFAGGPIRPSARPRGVEAGGSAQQSRGREGLLGETSACGLP